jgi:DNA polymerase-1
MPSLYLIDGHAYLHRAYHALPPLTNSKGQPVNAIYGFIRMMLKILKQEKPDYIGVCFDTAAPTFRHQAFADYKATRKETDDSLISQFPLAREAVAALGIACYELDGYEADDVIAHLTRKATGQGWNVVIVSADKDTLQLVNDKVKVLSEPKNVVYDATKVQERYGLPPERLPDYFALIGDSSDNVPGVSGIGPKGAVKLLQEFGTVENLIKSASQLKGKMAGIIESQAEAARQSLALVRLDGDVPLDPDWKQMQRTPPKLETLVPFLKKMEFFSMIDEIMPHEPASSATAQAVAGDYLAILSEEALQKWVREARGETSVAIEITTTHNNPLQAELLGLSISFKSGSGRYIPLRAFGLSGQALSVEVVRQNLGDILAGKAHKLFGHNLKYAQLVLRKHGLPLGTLYFDTMVASYVLNPSRATHDLKDVVLEMFGERLAGAEQLLGKGAQALRMDQVPLDKLVPYAAAQADLALRLGQTLEKQIREKQLDKLFHQVEMPLVEVLARMEEKGMRIDRRYLADLGDKLKQRADVLEKTIYASAGETFNINSPKQLSAILFEKLKLPVVRRTKTGFSTDEEVLQTLSASHALPASLIEYRELQKLRTTYVDGLQAGLLPGEDRIHTNFNQAVAATGRLSSSNPNLQNIPIRSELGRQIRKAFIPADGQVLLSADYSQIDLRVLAHISGDAALVEAFKRGEDIHTTTAADVFQVDPKQLTPDQRRAAKAINFGIVYGISPFGLSQQLQIPQEQAKQYIERYFERYPGVKKWIEQILNEAREAGYVKTLLGRIRYLPEIKSKNSAVRGFAERTAMNTPIQGTSADIIKVAMLQLEAAQLKGEWAGDMLVQVHDELLFEVPPAALPAASRVIKRIMEQALPLSVPVIVDLKSGPNWAEMKPL